MRLASPEHPVLSVPFTYLPLFKLIATIHKLAPSICTSAGHLDSYPATIDKYHLGTCRLRKPAATCHHTSDCKLLFAALYRSPAMRIYLAWQSHLTQEAHRGSLASSPVSFSLSTPSNLLPATITNHCSCLANPAQLPAKWTTCHHQ